MEEKFSHSNSPSMSDDIRQIGHAFALAKKKFTKAKKSSRNEYGKYSYAQIDEIYEAVEDALYENNIIIWHYADIFEMREVLYTRLIHFISGQYIQDRRFLESEKPGNQAKGSANTYMKKYAVLSLCAIATEDDDGAAEEEYIENRDQKRKKEPKITQDQLKDLQALIKSARNGRFIYDNVLDFNKIKDLAQLPQSSYEQVESYIFKKREEI